MKLTSAQGIGHSAILAVRSLAQQDSSHLQSTELIQIFRTSILLYLCTMFTVSGQTFSTIAHAFCKISISTEKPVLFQGGSQELPLLWHLLHATPGKGLSSTIGNSTCTHCVISMHKHPSRAEICTPSCPSDTSWLDITRTLTEVLA